MKKNIPLVVTSGLVSGFCFIIPQISFLIWISLIPLLLVLPSSERKNTFYYGLIFGVVFNATSIFWIAHVSVLGLCVMILYLSLYSIFFCVMSSVFISKQYALFSIPAAWVVVEFIKENVWCGFGWLNLGYTQYQNLALIQSADIFGVKSISFLIVMVNVLLWKHLTKQNNRIKNALVVAFVLLCSFGYSHYRVTALKSSGAVAVSVVQPNTPEGMKNRPETARRIVEQFLTLSQQTGKDSLVVFPEAAWPVVLREEDYSLIGELAQRIKRDILIGAVRFAKEGFYNCALYGNRDGRIISIYDKMRLTPFGEYVPLRKLFSFIEVLNTLGDMNRGKEFVTSTFQDHRFATLICFEDMFPLFVSKFSRTSDFLVNITNDEWFRGEPQAHQHVALLVFRAIENRRSMVRCANTGISGWVSFKGQVVTLKDQAKEVFFEGAQTYNLTLNRSETLYNKWGEFFPILCMAVNAIVFVITRKKKLQV